MSLVFFDFDGTMIKRPSAEKRFILYLLRWRVLRSMQLINFLIFVLRWIKPMRWTVWKKNKAYLAGLKVSRIQMLAAQFVCRKLVPDLRPEIQRLLRKHLARGDTVVLLTGTPDFIARPMARQLGIRHIAATVCDIHNGFFTASPPWFHPFGAAKMHIAEQICLLFNTSLDHCSAYADSASDYALLTSVSKPVAVSPDRKLRQAAGRKGWQIIC